MTIDLGYRTIQKFHAIAQYAVRIMHLLSITTLRLCSCLPGETRPDRLNASSLEQRCGLPFRDEEWSTIACLRRKCEATVKHIPVQIFIQFLNDSTPYTSSWSRSKQVLTPSIDSTVRWYRAYDIFFTRITNSREYHNRKCLLRYSVPGLVSDRSWRFREKMTLLGLLLARCYAACDFRECNM